MFLIPYFPLPSRPDTVVQFQAPNVEMATYFCKARPETEEADTTEYLNKLQLADSFSDSKTWTTQDRRTALWWIFINSRKDATISFNYDCAHCGEEHWHDCDMRELAEELEVLACPAEMPAATLNVQGEPHEFVAMPLNGHAVEQLERLRACLPPRGGDIDRARAYEREVKNLLVWELAYQLRLVGDTEQDPDKAAQIRYNLISKMDLGTELLALTNYVADMQATLRHGLNIAHEKGLSTILLPPHYCRADKFKEEAVRPSTRLLVPFRNQQFIPDLGTGSLANLSFQSGLVWWSADL
ncbi:morphogenetic protein [Nissabacter sp. SGAir0207]|uniref:morphogenetic protein n=1 Tax=Nissabacter sp. SGAir0207 TaxID=2126321 RepID=UPI0010CCF957|nr:morphogenetic protein [Nissabacter sp. SGAir0207]QCR38733.1 morphogenetic protein [Nissabacter sp. SGAir0207]